MSTDKGSKGASKKAVSKPKSRRLGQRIADLSAFVEKCPKDENCKACKLREEVKELVEWHASDEKRQEDRTRRKAKDSPKSAVREQLPNLLVALLHEAKTGNCQHAKLLLDFADAENLPDASEQEKSQSLAELLLAKIS